MTPPRYWYAVGRTIYARRGTEPHLNDPRIALAATEQIAAHIVQAHNQTVTVNARPAWNLGASA